MEKSKEGEVLGVAGGVEQPGLRPGGGRKGPKQKTDARPPMELHCGNRADPPQSSGDASVRQPEVHSAGASNPGDKEGELAGFRSQEPVLPPQGQSGMQAGASAAESEPKGASDMPDMRKSTQGGEAPSQEPITAAVHAQEKQRPLPAATPTVNPIADENGVLLGGDFQEQWKIASMMASSEMVPDHFRGKPAAVLMAMQTARSRGLNPLTAIQSMANIFGRTQTYGELPLAEAFASRKLKYFREYWFSPDGIEIKPTDFSTPAYGCCCIAEAHDSPQGQVIRIFTIDDAKQANLLDDPKRKTWRQYTKRMLQMRARGWCLKDTVPEVTAGMEMPGYDEHNEEAKQIAAPGGSLAERMNKNLSDGEEAVQD